MDAARCGLAPTAASTCFDYGWINQALTYDATQRELNQRGWPYEVLLDPSAPNNPLLIIGQRAWMCFDDESESRNRRIQKILLHNPVDASSYYARLASGCPV